MDLELYYGLVKGLLQKDRTLTNIKLRIYSSTRRIVHRISINVSTQAPDASVRTKLHAHLTTLFNRPSLITSLHTRPSCAGALVAVALSALQIVPHELLSPPDSQPATRPSCPPSQLSVSPRSHPSSPSPPATTLFAEPISAPSPSPAASPAPTSPPPSPLPASASLLAPASSPARTAPAAAVRAPTARTPDTLAVSACRRIATGNYATAS